jgi:hypothetical protein
MVPLAETTPGGPMKLLLTSAGIKNPTHSRRARRAAGQAHRRVERSLHTHRGVRESLQHSGRAVAVPQRTVRPADDRARLEIARRARADGASQRGFRPLGRMGPGDRCPVGERRRRVVSVPLDARVRSRGSPAVAARRRLGRVQRREHGADSPDRRGLRRLEVAQRQRRNDDQSRGSR